MRCPAANPDSLFFEHPQHGVYSGLFGIFSVKLRYLGLRGGEDLEGLEV